MASLNSVTQQLADNINQPFDNMLLARLEDTVISCRAILIRREFDRTRQFPSYAMYECLIPVTIETCAPCKGALVSIERLPRLIAVKNGSPFSYVGTDTREESISYILPEEIEIYKHNPISSKMPRYTYMNKKTYFWNIGNINKILHRGPFADPRDLEQYNCDEGTCFDADGDDFIEDHLVPLIKDMVYKEVGIRAVDDHNIQVDGE